MALHVEPKLLPLRVQVANTPPHKLFGGDCMTQAFMTEMWERKHRGRLVTQSRLLGSWNTRKQTSGNLGFAPASPDFWIHVFVICRENERMVRECEAEKHGGGGVIMLLVTLLAIYVEQPQHSQRLSFPSGFSWWDHHLFSNRTTTRSTRPHSVRVSDQHANGAPSRWPDLNSEVFVSSSPSMCAKVANLKLLCLLHSCTAKHRMSCSQTFSWCCVLLLLNLIRPFGQLQMLYWTFYIVECTL